MGTGFKGPKGRGAREGSWWFPLGPRFRGGPRLLWQGRVPVAALLRGREGPRPPVPVSQSDQISRADPSSSLKGDIFGRHRKCPTMPGRSNYAQFRFGRFSTETYPRPMIGAIDAKLSTYNTYLLMHFIWTKYLYFPSLVLVHYPTHVLGMWNFSEQ